MKNKKTSLYILSFALLLTACEKEASTPPADNLQNVEIPVHPTRALTTMYGWANDMVTHTSSSNTFYQTKDANDVIVWGSSSPAIAYRCTTDCSGFLKALILKTYTFTPASPFSSLFGKENPLAVDFYNAIAAKNHFIRRGLWSSMYAKGDIIAVKHTPTTSDPSTGHVMLIVSPPTLHTPSSAPLIYWSPAPGQTALCYQLEVKVIDEAESGHGHTDTRYVASGTGNSKYGDYYMGVGQGVLRLYTTQDGYLLGHSWSTLSGSDYYDLTTEPIEVGQFVR